MAIQFACLLCLDVGQNSVQDVIPVHGGPAVGFLCNSFMVKMYLEIHSWSKSQHSKYLRGDHDLGLAHISEIVFFVGIEEQAKLLIMVAENYTIS